MRRALLGWALALAGCGGMSTTPPATQVTGTVSGAPFAAKDAMHVTVVASGFDFNGTSTIVAITDYTAACAAETANQGTPNGGTIAIGAAIVDGSGNAAPASQAGDYQVTSAPLPAAGGKLAEVFFQRNDAHCLPTTKLLKSTGKVTITHPDAGDGQLEGTFDVTFTDTNEHVTGSFASKACPGFNPNRTATGGCT
jgi:hypothetical protein